MSDARPTDPEKVAKLVRAMREARGWSQTELAARAEALARKQSDPVNIIQQSIDQVERQLKKKPIPWIRYVWGAFEAGEAEMPEDPHVDFSKPDRSVLIELLPTYAGAGGGGTGEGDRQLRAFSGDLIAELGVRASDLLLIQIEGDSMSPEFLSGDQMLVDKRKRSLAQPGAFCLWDGDGYVVKYLEKVPGSDPAKVRVISGNQRYSAWERLVDEVQVMGRIIWFGRRV